MAKKLSELRYGGAIIALAADPETLLLEKAQMIVDSSVRYPELLEIYFRGLERWLFDEKMTKKRASYVLHEGFPYA